MKCNDSPVTVMRRSGGGSWPWQGSLSSVRGSLRLLPIPSSYPSAGHFQVRKSGGRRVHSGGVLADGRTRVEPLRGTSA